MRNYPLHPTMTEQRPAITRGGFAVTSLELGCANSKRWESQALDRSEGSTV